MLRWPERARTAIRKLFEPLQDIDVFVEDINDEAFYRCLLKSATKNEVKIARVFGLGGKLAVINAARVHDQKARRALFIIDGDLSWVKGESAPDIIGLHRHDAYCIENLILCEKALSLLLSQEIVVTEDEAAMRLAYKTWINSIEIPLLKLFSAFATVHDFDPTIPTISQGVRVVIKHCSTGRTELDITKVSKARDEALKAAESAGNAATISATYEYMFNRLRNLPNPLYAVSGKDFLIPLVEFHLRSLGCRQIKRKSLRVRLASAGDITRFASLAKALSQAASGYV